jgi:hypothetical protein
MELRNVLMRFTLRCLQQIHTCDKHQGRKILVLLEHPEDLGVSKINDMGSWPASVWQLPEVRQFHSHLGWHTVGLNQCLFGAHSPKPARFLSNMPGLTQLGNAGWPTFSDTGVYSGPIPPCGHNHEKLVGCFSPDGRFRTAASAAYPPALCTALANIFLQDLSCTRTPSEGGQLQVFGGTGEVEVQGVQREGTGTAVAHVFPLRCPFPSLQQTHEASEVPGHSFSPPGPPFSPEPQPGEPPQLSPRELAREAVEQTSADEPEKEAQQGIVQEDEATSSEDEKGRRKTKAGEGWLGSGTPVLCGGTPEPGIRLGTEGGCAPPDNGSRRPGERYMEQHPSGERSRRCSPA